jgi:hypothetical protein
VDAVDDVRFKDNVIIGGLMLCKAPLELVAERTEYYDNMAQSQMRSVDNNLMRENDPRMPCLTTGNKGYFRQRKLNLGVIYNGLSNSQCSLRFSSN